MKNLEKHILIFSVMKNNLEKSENEKRHDELKVWLSSLNIPFREVMGYYKGSLETSVIVNADETTRRFVEMACRDYSQDCYLESYPDRSTYLVYADGTESHIGTLRPHGASMPDSDSWTYAPETGLYYVTN